MKTTSLFILLTTVHACFAGTPGSEQKSFTAHEWGTFTSVQAADGVQMGWNPLIVSELPKFVYDRRPGGTRQGSEYLTAKSSVALQRMETPVLYFYSDREQTVDVTVRFPQGTVTEWFPQMAFRDRSVSNLLSGGPKTIRWDQVRILPRTRNQAMASLLPTDPSGSHYYAARETEADFLQVAQDNKGGRTVETEKFLFYRGLGGFPAPLTVAQTGDDAESLKLTNTGTEELRHLFIYAVRNNQAKVVFVPELAPGASRTVQFSPGQSLAALAEVRQQVADEMAEALVTEGLFRAEAKAMVKTWADSWFTEPGVRVLYVLPRVWTDRILPLTLEPKPKEIVRVMVGRAELITPRMEWNLMKQLVRYADADESVRARTIEATRELGLGRFLEPAMRRLETKFFNQELSGVANKLLRSASASGKAGKELAAK